MRRGACLALTLCAALAGPGGAAPQPQPELVGRYVWTSEDPGFGGLSAIDLTADGVGFVALSDRGTWIAGTLRRDVAGRIVGVDAGPPMPLQGRGAAALPKQRSDAEGLAVAPDGTVFVAFEIAPRVLRYDRLPGPATYLPIPRDFNRMRPNGALEALALAPDGALYTLPEESILRTGDFPVYRFRDGVWDQPFTLPKLGGHLPVGADFGPDGRLYLLERSFGLTGFASRVRRFTLTPDGIDAGETLIDTPPGTHGNLEGLSVWRDAAGALRLTLIADNNFHSFLTTEIVEYGMPE